MALRGLGRDRGMRLLRVSCASGSSMVAPVAVSKLRYVGVFCRWCVLEGRYGGAHIRFAQVLALMCAAFSFMGLPTSRCGVAPAGS